MHSTLLYNISTGGYVASLALFALHLVNTRKLVLKIGVLAVASSFLVQTCGMVARWIEAGHLEVAAAERAVGHALTGWSWFVVFTQHPPWSNLYEIMVYMSWGIIMVTLFAEMKWQLAWVRQMGIILALMALGMAALTDSAITPLVPALKSWWIMIHVISASVAYASGAIAAFICFFALMKDQERVRTKSFAGLSLIFMGALLLFLGGGPRLIKDQSYYVKLLAQAGEGVVSVMDVAQAQAQPFLIGMPGAGWALICTILAHLVLGLIMVISHEKSAINMRISQIFLACYLMTLTVFFITLIHDITNTLIAIDANTAHHLAPAGPWFLGFKSHPWSFGLLVLVVILESLMLLFLFKPEAFRSRLPGVIPLEGAAYKAISLSFFLMTVVLITGALWAHYAWGRYWAWDPKETGALAIWLNYAIYLHARRTPGLSGTASSLIGVFGFFVIIIGFLGVNLGLFANGLHTYGNS